MKSYSIPIGTKIQIFDKDEMLTSNCVLVKTAKNMFALIDMDYWNRWEDPTYYPDHIDAVSNEVMEKMVNIGVDENYKYTWRIV